MAKGIIRKDGTYYIEVAAQGSRKRFLSAAGRTLKEARARLKAMTAPPKEQSYRLFDHYQEPVDEDAIWRAASRFRVADTKAFAATKRIVLHTDQPEYFHHAASTMGQVIRRNGFAFDTISTDDLREKGLADHDVAIFPGGFGYFPDRKLASRIRTFVRNGGGYVGFCAGAFLPLKNSCGVKGVGLGMLDAKYVYFRERGLCDVALNPADPVARGIESSTRPPVYALYKPCRAARKHTVHVSLMRGNGPLMVPGTGATVVGYYDGSEKYGAIVRGTYGKGRIVAFSAHPDAYPDAARMGSMADAVECVKLVKNALLYCGRVG